MKKQLRHCSAYVNVNDRGFCNSYELVSYATPVALLGIIDGEIVDDFGEVHECHGHALLVNDSYDCSVTTMQHVRKFIEDYIGACITITDIRRALRTDNILCHGGANTMISVYHVSWA